MKVNPFEQKDENPYAYFGSREQSRPGNVRLEDGFHYEETEPNRFTFSYILAGNFFLSTSWFFISLAAIGVPAFLFLVLERYYRMNESFCFAVFLFLLFSIWGIIFYYLPLLVRGYNFTNLILRRRWTKNPDQWIVQFTTYPRVNTGCRGFLDDADDIGTLQIEDSGLRFQGDHTSLFLPYRRMKSLSYYSEIPRTMGLSKRSRIELQSDGEIPFHTLEFSELESRRLLDIWGIPKKLHRQIKERFEQSRR